MWYILARYFQAKSNVIAEKYINHAFLAPTCKKEVRFAGPCAGLVFKLGSVQPSCHWSQRSRT